jgi:steroid delta-isomerase-like uncharacterized protein
MPHKLPIRADTDFLDWAWSSVAYGWHRSRSMPAKRHTRNQMSTDENKAVVRRFIDETFVKGNPESVDDLVSASFVPHTWPSVQPGRESLKQTVARMASGLSDVAFDIQDMIAEGDRVAVRVTARATHEGDFMGMPAAGKRYEIAEIHIFRLENGLIAEHWHVADMLGMMKQIGAMPG